MGAEPPVALACAAILGLVLALASPRPLPREALENAAAALAPAVLGAWLAAGYRDEAAPVGFVLAWPCAWLGPTLALGGLAAVRAACAPGAPETPPAALRVVEAALAAGYFLAWVGALAALAAFAAVQSLGLGLGGAFRGPVVALAYAFAALTALEMSGHVARDRGRRPER